MRLRALLRDGNADTLADYLNGNRMDPNILVLGSWTALMYATCHGTIECVRVLLDRGADPNFIDTVSRRCTRVSFVPMVALHIACNKGHFEIARLLLDRGADPFIVEPRCGWTAVDWAQHGHNFGRDTRAVHMLLRDMFDCRKDFFLRRENLHRELVEYLFHPLKLFTQGYFCVVE